MQKEIQIEGTFPQLFLLFGFWLTFYEAVLSAQELTEQNHLPLNSELANSPSYELFEPIEISPAVFPDHPLPTEPLSPMYPTFPNTYNPVLSGKCPANFSGISSILEKTASDCSQPLAAFVGNAICCPQFSSLLHIFQGYYGLSSTELVLKNGTADDCFSDIITVLVSQGANSSIDSLCSLNSSSLTGGSCPVKDVHSFEERLNTSKLLEDCETVDPLKECCRPVCQPAIVDAALQLSAGLLTIGSTRKIIGGAVDVINDCKMVVYSWLSRKLPAEAANTAFRALTACKVNKVCPLKFQEPSEVVEACQNKAAPSPSCCSALTSYVGGIQKQMLITNKQAIVCATMFASMLQNAGIMTNIYKLCDVDLKDFNLQAFGQQGCLLGSLPVDVIFDNTSGYSFSCDLNDDTEAPWPSSSSMATFSLCAEKSLAALPTSNSSEDPGTRSGGLEFALPLFSFIVFVFL